MTKIAIDLDGVLAHYEKWDGIESIGDPLPGAQDLVKGLIDSGCEVWIFTTRMSKAVNSSYSVRELQNNIQDWLIKHDFPMETLIWTGHGKMIADFYIDDRAIGFRGDWKKVLEEMENML